MIYFNDRGDQVPTTDHLFLPAFPSVGLSNINKIENKKIGSKYLPFTVGLLAEMLSWLLKAM